MLMALALKALPLPTPLTSDWYSEYRHLLLEQVGRGSQFPLAIQVAVAVVTPAETSYPLSQV